MSLSLVKQTAPNYSQENKLKVIAADGKIVDLTIPAGSTSTLTEFITAVKSAASPNKLLLAADSLLYITTSEHAEINSIHVIFDIAQVAPSKTQVGEFAISDRILWGAGGFALGAIMK